MTELKQVAQRALPLLDLTSLNEDDTPAVIRALCKKAVTPFGSVAAVCVYPAFVKLASECLARTPVKIATVINFPDGQDSLIEIEKGVRDALFDGAQEIDVVIDYRDFIAGNTERSQAIIALCKKYCIEKNAQLKVILETGELKKPELIAKASELSIAAGADFLKTSTGKVAINATLEAATIMLQASKNHHSNIAFKAAGGVRTCAQAEPYLALADKILGSDWVTAAHFRFGASGLLDDILTVLADG